MFNNRQIEIIKIILKNTNGIKGAEIAKNLGVSSRTIRNDIALINSSLEKNKRKIKSSNKVGYYINNEDEKEFKKLFLNQDFKVSSKELTRDERSLEIIIKCLFMGQQNIYDLSEEFFVSPQTIYSDCKYSKETIHKLYNFNEVKLSSEYMNINGTEEEIRELLFMILNDYITMKDDDLISQVRLLVNNNFSIEEYIRLEEKIINLFLLDNKRLHDKALSKITSAIYISMKRNDKGFYIDYENDMKRLRFEKSVPKDFITKLIGVGFNLYPIDQVPLGNYIWGMKLYNTLEKVDMTSDMTMKIMDEFTTEVYEKYGLSLKDSEEVSSSLEIHLEYLLRRMDYGYRLKNPLLEDIKSRYVNSYEIAILIVQKIYQYKLKYPSDDEIAYIAMHIEYLLQINNQKLKTVIVFDSSYAFNSIVESWLENNFSDSLLIIKRIPMYLLSDYLSEHTVDLVVSIRKPNLLLEIPQFNIDQLPGSKDYDLIKNLIHKLIVGSKYEKIIREMFSIEFINFYEEDTLNSLITNMSNDLQEKKYINNAQEFSKDILEREDIYPTPIEHGVTILHALSSFANKSVVSVAILNKPIKYRDTKIHIIFLLAIENKLDYDVNKIFHFSKQLLSNKKALEDLKAINSGADFLEQLIYYSRNLQLLDGTL